eukprot:scaffold78169_cov50-Cyclotella_meneghiniana.AAC.5
MTLLCTRFFRFTRALKLRLLFESLSDSDTSYGLFASDHRNRNACKEVQCVVPRSEMKRIYNRFHHLNDIVPSTV